MKHSSQQTRPLSLPSKVQQRGFALISTISIMVLLVLIVIGMLALSTTETKKAKQSEHQLVAQANARMALMIALSELQDYAGADQRVTATGSIIDGAIPEKAHWTGVWSTENWDPTSPNSNREFLKWLVSSKSTAPSATGDVTSPLTGQDLVTLVGAGSVGSDSSGFVQAEKINVNPGGAYAYWVGDQGVKATSGLVAHDDSNAWNKSSQLSLVGRVGLEATEVAGMENYASKTAEEIKKSALSLRTLDSLQGTDVTSALFHDVAPLNLSLLTDVRLGGMAKDLSTAFELPLDKFNELEEFHASNERNSTGFYSALSSSYDDEKFYPESNSPNLGYLSEIRSGSNLFRGPTWDLLRNHYRFYKKEWDGQDAWKRGYAAPANDSFAARGALPLSYSRSESGANGPNGVFAYHQGIAALYGKAYRGGWAYSNDLLQPRGGLKNTALIAQSPKLSPIVARVAIGIGVVKHESPDWKLALSFDPYITLVNPYNVPISFQSVGLFCSKFSPLDIQIEYTDRNSGAVRTTNFGQPFSPNTYNQGAFAVRLEAPGGSGAWMLKPGEVKVISPTKISSGGAMNWGAPTGVRGQFSYSEGSGLYWNHLHIKPRDGTTVKVTLKGKGGNEATMMTNSIFYAKDHNGGARDVIAHLPPSNQYGDNDNMDDPFLSKIAMISSASQSGSELSVERLVNTSGIPRSDQADSAYVAVLDLKMKTAAEDVPLFWMNPRGQSFDPRDYDGTGRSGLMWSATLDGINDISELQIVGNPDGNGYWGDGYKAGSGTSNVVLYEVPQLPMTSLAQFQHADISVTSSGGTMQIGNSFANSGIADLNAIYGRRSRASGNDAYNVDKAMQSLGDLAWASNEMLWDRYFFSGLNWGGAALPLNSSSQPYKTQNEALDALIKKDDSAKQPLMNPRIVLSGLNKDKPTVKQLEDFDSIAQYLAINGGFNVNSTSKNAWKAVFSTLREADIKYNDAGSLQTTTAENAFSRFTIPVAQSADTWNGGFHELTNEDVDKLAEAMVEQVKERGPFMGLADFVNRRLDSKSGSQGTDVGVLGALQAAIEKAGLNDRSDISNAVSSASIEHKTFSVAGDTKSLSTYVGTPSYIMQADILSTIGSTLRARSDTFIIRGYGESKDSNGKVQSRAWCEATVQRCPDWVEDTTEKSTILDSSYASNSPSGDVVTRPWIKNPNLPASATSVGRKFKMLSFRWLSNSEV